MTEEFKQALFDYLTGRLPNEKGQYKEIFKEINDTSIDEWIGFVPNGWNNFRYEGLIEVANSELLVLYGGYKTTNDEVRGIVTILDNNFKPLKTFYQFESGTYLRYIMCMIQEDDGNFSFVDCPEFPKDENWSFVSSQKRFIMTNNFTQKINDNYILRLQRSYIMPYTNLYCKKMYKDPNSSHYVMLCSVLRDQSGPVFDKTRIIELKINVGSENEWNYTDTEDNWILGDAYVEFDNNSNSFVELILSTNNLSRGNVIATWTKNFNSTTYQYKTIHTFNYMPYIDSWTYCNQSVFLNKNELYFVQNNQNWGVSGKTESKYIGLYYYNIQTSEFKPIYEKYLGEYDFCNKEAIYITENNNELYIEFNDKIDTTNYNANYYIQRLKDNKWNPIQVAEQQYFIRNQRAIYVNNNYNLLNIFAYVTNPRRVTWKIFNIKENYNFANYTGERYINENALIPNSAEVYSDDKFVFARNLYNKTISNNTTVSSVEITNTYLNDIDLTSKILLSKTNLNMINDTDIFRKNKYETVFLNFINSLQVIDKNNSNDVLNREASTNLNYAVNTENQYDKMKLYNKAIIYYQDSTFKEIGYQLKKLSRLSVDLILTVYADKEVDRIEFVSNDKTVVYQTIDLSNLELNKTYVIKQNLKIQDIERNTATASGTSIHIEDSIYAQFKEFSIDGVLEQETTNGYQLFDERKLPSKTSNGVTLTNNSDGSFTISGTGKPTASFNYSYTYSHEETLKLLKVGNITISDDGVQTNVTSPYYLAQLRNSSGTIFEVSNRISNNGTREITQEMVDDESTVLRIGFFAPTNIEITPVTIKPMLYQNGDGIFERFTGGKASPNPDYSQEIKTVKDNFEIITCGKNLFNVNNMRLIDVVKNDDVFEMSFNNENGNGNKYLEFHMTNLDVIEKNTDYTIIAEILEVSGNGLLRINGPDSGKNRGQFPLLENYSLKSLRNGQILIWNTKSLNDFSESRVTLRSQVLIGKGNSCSMKLRVSIIKGTITSDSFIYEPYKESRTLIELTNDKFIGSLGNIKGQLKIEYTNDDNYHLFLYKNIKKIVLDGSDDEGWLKFDVVQGKLFRSKIIQNEKKDNTYAVKCSHYVGIPANVYQQRVDGNIYLNSSLNYLDIIDNRFTTLEEFKTWLSNNNVEIYYELANTLRYDLGQIDMPYSYDNITNVFTTSTLNPNMNVTYYTDSKIKNRRRIGE